ncbi:MAG: hypothetical protein IH889_03350 [Planctomycetes bacterium]|nr:hypothetical protein [Planctomycetota bacterium]
MQDSTRNANTAALLEHLYRSGTGDSKIARIKAIVASEPDIGVAMLIERMSADGLPPGTIRKAEEWMSDPSAVLEPRVRRSVGEMLVADAVLYNRKREASHVESS